MTDTPLDHVTRTQATATDPKASIWVSANAGSGKTYVLSRRVIRLLLEGSKPSELLCLTFTKAAAAEMSNRVFKILSEWAMMDEDALAREVRDIIGRELTQQSRARWLNRARILFAIALDSPGGLRIQTIHAFCESLLHQFPLEANVPGHFEMMDDQMQGQMLAEARRHVILSGLGLLPGTGLDSDIGREIGDAFDVLRGHASDAGIEKAIGQLVRDREDFADWIERGGGNARRAFAPMWRRFSLTPQTRKVDLIDRFANHSCYSDNDWNELIDMARAKSAASYSSLAENLKTIRSTKDTHACLQLRLEVFLTQKMEPRKSLVHKTFLENHPAQITLFENEQTLLLEQLDQLKTLKALRASEALFFIAEAILVEYGNLKRRKGVLDFGDLIARSANLLNRSEIRQWVQYKLDSGISHLLIDEAQDTSPIQWQIVEAITSEFYSGEAAHRQIRTVFVVGDEKQSIFSFQGADPQEFALQFAKLEKKSKGANLAFYPVKLTTSFRSAPEVLSAVDQVFSLPENAAGLDINGKQQVHQANRQSDRGEVILWPLIRRRKKPEKTDWLRPPDEPTPLDAEVLLAVRIAETIEGWITTGERLPGRDRPIRHGDILVLVRKRDRFVAAINRELKTRALAAAGADRLKLTEHIAVEDMIALGRFATMETDDLSLAAILKSPLFDFDEDELFAVAHDRKNTGLYRQLLCLDQRNHDDGSRKIAGEKLAWTVSVLRDIRSMAGELPVHAFYGSLFARFGLRQKYLTRLGHEVAEILDGFLQEALNYDDNPGLGLQGFVEGMANSELELKREIDLGRDEIRVITAHSSKGLEAPIVFLVDPGSKAFNTSHAPAVIRLDDADGQQGYLWQGGKKTRNAAADAVFKDFERAAEEEYRRLLYVGMTRAADRLIICGYCPEKEFTYDHWYSMVEKGLQAPIVANNYQGRLEEIDKGGDSGGVRRWVIVNDQYREKGLKNEGATDSSSPPKIPDWVSPMPRELPAPRPLSPSGVMQLLDIGQETDFSHSADVSRSLDRGNAIHHLLQILPDTNPEKRDNMIESYFKLSGVDFDAQTIQDIAGKVRRVIADAANQFLFAEGSRAEVELSGKVRLAGRTHIVRGKIDRLVVEPGRVVIADYKTNRHFPATSDDVSAEYIAQMALYRELIREIHPRKSIECYILWTESGSLMILPDPLLDLQISLLNQPVIQDLS